MCKKNKLAALKSKQNVGGESDEEPGSLSETDCFENQKFEQVEDLLQRDVDQRIDGYIKGSLWQVDAD